MRSTGYQSVTRPINEWSQIIEWCQARRMLAVAELLHRKLDCRPISNDGCVKLVFTQAEFRVLNGG